MTCTCGTKFCWICLKNLSKDPDAYAHFREIPTCGLFDSQQNDREVTVRVRPNEIREKVAEVIQSASVGRDPESGVTCPNCKRINFRFNRENRVKCWNCPLVFCGACRKKLKTSKEQRSHFGKTGCPQHWRPPPRTVTGSSSTGAAGTAVVNDVVNAIYSTPEGGDGLGVLYMQER